MISSVRAAEALESEQEQWLSGLESKVVVVRLSTLTDHDLRYFNRALYGAHLSQTVALGVSSRIPCEIISCVTIAQSEYAVVTRTKQLFMVFTGFGNGQ